LNEAIRKSQKLETNEAVIEMTNTIKGYTKVVENCMWLLANISTNSANVIEKIVVEVKVFSLIAQTLEHSNNLTLEFFSLLEYLLDTVKNYYKSEWYLHFTGLIHSLSHLIVPFLNLEVD
jgi:hypothetical protein